MKRRELFKMFATLAAMPLVAPLAEKCLRAEQPKPISGVSDADRWRKMCGYGKESTSTLSCVSVNALVEPFLFKAGDMVTIGDDPNPSVITKVYSHGVDVIRGEQS